MSSLRDILALLMKKDQPVPKLVQDQSSQIAPSLSFASPQEGSTATANAETPFGARVLNPGTEAGLVGMDPRYFQDPRFDYKAGIDDSGKLGMTRPGEKPISTKIGNAVNFLPDLDDKTVAGDMWAVTLGGHSGTSPGDQANPVFVQAAKAIVGDGKQITPEMVKKMKQFMLEMRQPDFRQRHKGPAWLPGVKAPDVAQ